MPVSMLSVLLNFLLYGFNYFSFNLFGQFYIILQQIFNCLTTLPQLGIIITKPAAALLDNAQLNSHINNLACSGDTFSIHNIKLSLTEWWSYLVLYNTNAGLASYYLITILELGNLTNI